MSIVLGIDTGGTYTDGVIIDLDTKEILADTKARTTHEDLIVGIRNTIQQLDYKNLKELDYVSLSTTLATNAIVEGRGCRVGLLLLGFEPVDELPSCECILLPGKISTRGKESEALDLKKTKKAILSLKDKVDAVAISGIFSIHNPVHEETVRKMVRELLGLPTVAAHELTAVLGMQERTVTAVLNARLISVIDELMTATKAALKEKKVYAPIMIVKGDGSLMSETVARERPIETILSGPAASIIGSTYLNDAKEGLVLDMGGTTTDIAVLRDGIPRLDKEGARVGGWRTRVNAVEASTFGLGGDSRIFMDYNSRKTQIGPMRCWPISVITAEYPSYLVELLYIKAASIGMIVNELAEGYFILREPPRHMELTTKQQQVISVLRDGPHTIAQIAKAIDSTPNFLNVDSLVEHGILGMIGFTPTDILHAEGTYTIGCTEGAKVAAELMANVRDISVKDFLTQAKTLITDKLCRVVLSSAMAYENFRLNGADDMTLESLFQTAVWQKNNEVLDINFQLKTPIIGIGAPVKAWLSQAAEKFQTPTVYPVHNDVANAIGAAAGKVMTVYSIKIQNHEQSGVDVFAPWGIIPVDINNDWVIQQYDENLSAQERTDKIGGYSTTKGKMVPTNVGDVRMEAAIEQAITVGKARMDEEMRQQEIEDYTILVERKDVKTGNGYNENIKMHIETYLDIIAVGKPSWK